MTLLRRTAQLVADLRTLGVLNKKDTISFQQNSDGSIELTIYWEPTIYRDKEIDTVKHSLENEFGQINIKVSVDVKSFFSCIILLQ